MSRASRFDKLESDRGEKPSSEPKVAEERFAEAPERSEPVVAHTPVMEAALEHSSRADELAEAPQLKRFETDGANHLSLDTDELVRLPFRRCAACQRDSSKFDRTCIFCQASLESPEARELNLSILASYEADQAKAAAALVEQHQANIKQIVEDEFQRQVELEKEAQRRVRVGPRGWLVAAAVGCFVIAIAARSFCPSLGLVVLGLGLIVAALPSELKERLTSRASTRFGRW